MAGPLSITIRGLVAAAVLSIGCCITLPAQASVVDFARLDPLAAIAIDPSQAVTGRLHYVTSTGLGSTVNLLVGADRFYNAGYTGSNGVMANIEAGHIWNGHTTLTHVTTQVHGGGALGVAHSHATRVGFVMGGRPYGTALTEGIAPDATLRSGAIATNISGAFFSISYQSFIYAYTNNLVGFGAVDVINSSWGFTDAPANNFYTIALDGLANANPATAFVVAAGNAGSGANSVGGPASGYNAISVGALANNGSDLYNSIAGFSSRGPQDYWDPVTGTVAGVRAPVDISAPGDTLTLANTGGANVYSTGQAGTSFAAPAVAGAVGLMADAARSLSLPATALDTRVIKANLMNAAEHIPGWNNGQVAHPNGFGGVRTTQSLDYVSGAGALDLDRTYDQYLTGTTDLPGLGGGTTSDVVGWDFAEVTLGLSTDIVINQALAGGSPFRAALTWFRERQLDALNAIAYDLAFADLNLEIWDSTFTTLYSDSISLYNESELLAFYLPTTGLYGLRVTYPANRFDFIGLTTEQFALAWWAESAESAGVPEPSLVLLLTAGFALIRARRRR